MTLPAFKRVRSHPVSIVGVPSSVPASASALFRSRVDTAARDLVETQGLHALNVSVQCGVVSEDAAESQAVRQSSQPAPSNSSAALKYTAREPLFGPDALVISAEVRRQLDEAIQILELQPLLFDTWGLSEIEPFPRSALNFHGPPGTGKTLAAHAAASATGRKILCATYADIESMYHGEGPKNVVELFRAAEAANAVLFIDEADSLLSRRLTNVMQGSEQAANSMRSQLLLSLDGFRGLVVFATNLVSNYDPAFDTRVRHIHFPAPDRVTLIDIWRRHLPTRLPVSEISLENLANRSEGLVGRDVKNAVIAAAVSAARSDTGVVSEAQLLSAIDSIRRSRAEKETVQLNN